MQPGINDLHDFLVGGVDLNGFIIRILLYADDMVIVLASSPRVLQIMINKLGVLQTMEFEDQHGQVKNYGV